MNDSSVDPFVILMVDDNPNNLFTLRALLKRFHDCEILEAGSGEQALVRVVERQVHLILLDVQMPGMDGFETARHLQMTERTRHIPIIFITAVFKASEFVRRGYEVGAVDYLTKPIDDSLLINRIRLHQGLFRRERQLAATLELLRKNEQILITARDAAEAANRAKSTFLANMSHELRTPLNAILGFTQFLERDALIGESHGKALATIKQSGQHLLALINDILEISRIEAGRAVVHSEAFDLRDTIATIEEMVQPRAQAKRIALIVTWHGEAPTRVLGDATHLRQILINLLGNAIKYTDRGHIALHLYPLGDQVRFEVADSGHGIAPEDQDRIFQAFYQTQAGAAKGEGTGLGLAISREFVRLMGGELTVTSRLGEGSVFSFTLPLPAASECTEVAAHGAVVGLVPGQPDYRVLIVEDEPVNRDLLRMIMEDVGFRVREATNGQEAVAVFQAWSPHFIWMDIRMSGMDGLAATRAIRALPGGQLVKIAALTASAFQEDRTRIFAAGCDEVAIKPFETAHLFQIMADQLGLHYCYAATMPAPQGTALEPVDVSALSTPLREALRTAAELLDLETTQTLVTTLRTDHPGIARMITGWLNNYRFDQLLEWCEQTGVGNS